MSRRVPAYPALLAVALVLSIVLPSGGSPYAAIRLVIGLSRITRTPVCTSDRRIG